jgi:hypothetical protein
MSKKATQAEAAHSGFVKGNVAKFKRLVKLLSNWAALVLIDSATNLSI